MFNRVEYRIGLGIQEDRNGHIIPPIVYGRAIALIGERAAELFGGYTITDTTGGWVDGHGKLIEEPGITLSILVEGHSRTADPVRQTRDEQVIAFARFAGRALRQHSVALILPDGRAGIIECGD